ncbi:V-set and transmembrane domain-containing protein 2A [Pimephales promelas]|uniref:V-set and transmembrane domain-containing protein 2A n=1 Tax=Pimephales promelas TaxID=90988 RepID=UPI00195582A0|nr:V-set and transmembrane domain-containing protein 2A [Pimephales promelas]KAG1953629.1 V-set and transmembrane domain-containing protein 2A [Pimephales promelas]
MMGTLHDSIGFVLFSCLSIQVGFSFDGKFTDFPSNITAREGQNIEMACAFQSGMSSVYLEIQWWFRRAPEELMTSEEDEDDVEMELIPDPDPDEEGTKISTVKVQGNDISHKLQLSGVSKNDEGLYECRVTDANDGELKEYKAQAILKVNATARPRSRAVKKSSPLHLTDKKPRKNSPGLGQDSNMSSDQRSQSTSTSQTAHSHTHQHSSGTRIATSNGLALLLLLTSGLLRDAWL